MIMLSLLERHNEPEIVSTESIGGYDDGEPITAVAVKELSVENNVQSLQVDYSNGHTIIEKRVYGVTRPNGGFISIPSLYNNYTEFVAHGIDAKTLYLLLKPISKVVDAGAVHKEA